MGVTILCFVIFSRPNCVVEGGGAIWEGHVGGAYGNMGRCTCEYV